MTLTNADRTRIRYTLGVEDTIGLRGAWPELGRLIDRLFEDRVSRLPWVPKSWLQAVREVQAANPQDLIRLAPGRDKLGRRQEGAPSFADDDAKLDVWVEIWKAQQKATEAYAAKQVEVGRREIDRLVANAAFWDAAYTIADTAKNLPANIVKATGRGAAEFVGTFLPDSLKSYARLITWALVLLIVGGLVLWYRKRLGGIVKGFKTGVKA